MTGIRFAESVAIVEDEHGAVLLDTRNATMFGLNSTAAAFCAALAAGLDCEAAVQRVVNTFEADQQLIRSDVAALLDELTRHSLVEQAT